MINGPNNSAISRYTAESKASKKPPATAPETSATPPGSATPTTAAASSGVSLSKEAQMLQRLEKEINSYPNVDSEKIANIKNQLAAGGYHINSASVAQKMMLLDSLY